MNDTLTHHGIFGMKWGVRRDPGPDGTVSGKSKAKSEDKLIKKERRSDSKNRRMLSDKDLLEKIGRLEREKKLRELTEKEIAPGKKAASDILKTAGTTVVTTAVTAAGIYGIRALLSRNVDPIELAAYFKPKK